jgi:hypothetical protein
LSTIIFQAPQPLSSIDADANGKPIGLALLWKQAQRQQQEI